MPRPNKRQIVLDTAGFVFGRDGYARASIDVIAAEAGVSTRTLYNHFPSKGELFTAVIRDSAGNVARAFEEVVAQTLIETANPRGGLIELAVRWHMVAKRHPEHFALVKMMDLEREHVPPEVSAAWNTAGPERTMATLAATLSSLKLRGPVQPSDTQLMAVHFLALTVAAVASMALGGVRPPDRLQERRIIEAGVSVFLAGYDDR